jgi:hypothetical protein
VGLGRGGGGITADNTHAVVRPTCSAQCLSPPSKPICEAKLYCYSVPHRYCCICTAVMEAKGLSLAVSRMRRITQQLPPCLFVPHTVKAWHTPPSSSSSGGQQQQQQQQECGPAVVAGEALATVGVSTLASLLQEVSGDRQSLVGGGGEVWEGG